MWRGAVLGVVCVLLAGTWVATVAHAVVEHEMTTNWAAGTEATLPRGQVAMAEVRVNANDSMGAHGVVENVTFMMTMNASGQIPSVPQACATQGVSPVSHVTSGPGNTLVCTLERQTLGTAAVVTVPVTAVGAGGAMMQGTVVQGAHSAALPPLRITATDSVNVTLANNGAHAVSGATGGVPRVFTLPVGVGVLTGGTALNGRVEFDIRLTAGNSRAESDPATVSIAQRDCARSVDTSGIGIQQTPSNGSGGQVPAPTSCVVSETAPGVFHVDVRFTDPGSYWVNHENMTAYWTAFPVQLQIPAAPNPCGDSPSLLHTVSAVTATTMAGTAVAETYTADNTASVVWPQGCGWAAGFTWFDAALNSPWGVSLRTYPGQAGQIAVNSLLLRGHAPAEAPTPAAACVVIDPRGLQFTGGATLTRLDAQGVDTPSTATRTVFYLTDPVADPNTFACASGSWSATPPAVLTSVTAVKIVWDPATDEAPVGTGYPGHNYAFHVPVKVAENVSVGQDLYTFGSATVPGSSVTDTANWQRLDQPTQCITDTPSGSRYPCTTGGRDYMQVAAGTPTVTNTVTSVNGTARTGVSTATVAPGDVVGYTIAGRVQSRLRKDTTTLTLVDILPLGLEYTPSSATPVPASVANNADGTTTLTWVFPNARYNTDHAVAYTAKASALGSLTSRVTADAPGSPHQSSGVPLPVAEATVTVLASGTTTLTTTATESRMPANGSETWVLRVANQDSQSQSAVDVLDVLPYPGDTTGSVFHGSLAVTGVTAPAGCVTWYTTRAAASLSRDPADPSNGALAAPNPAVWAAATTPPEHSTAFRVVCDSLAMGEVLTVTATTRTTGNVDGDRYAHLATARATHTALRMLSAATATVSAPRLVFRKMVDRAVQVAGGDLLYTLAVTNTGSQEATGYRVTDLLPSGVTFVSASPVPIVVEGRTMTWTVPKIAERGGTATIEVRVRLNADTAGATVVNSARLTPSSGVIDGTTPTPALPCPATDGPSATDASWSCATTLVPKMLQDNTVDRPVTRPSDTLTYTLRFANAGPTPIRGMQPADLLPAGVQYVGDDGHGVVTGRRIAFPATDIAVGGSLVIHVTVTVTEDADVSQLLTNGAKVTNPTESSGGPGLGGCMDATSTRPASACVPVPQVEHPCSGGGDLGPTWSCAVSRMPALRQDNTVDRAVTRVGDTLTYTLTVVNTGAVDLTAVPVADTLPPGVAVQDAAGGTVAGRTVTWTLPSLAVAEVRVFTVTVRVTADADVSRPLLNVARATPSPVPAGPGASANPAGGLAVPVTVRVEHPCATEDGVDASWSCAVSRMPALRQDHTVDHAATRIGDILTYTLTVTNTGAVDLTAVPVTDQLPAGVVFHTATGGGVHVDGQIRWVIPRLPAATVTTLTVTALVATHMVPGNPLRSAVQALPTITDSVTGTTTLVSVTVDHPCPTLPDRNLTAAWSCAASDLIVLAATGWISAPLATVAAGTLTTGLLLLLLATRRPRRTGTRPPGP